MISLKTLNKLISTIELDTKDKEQADYEAEILVNILPEIKHYLNEYELSKVPHTRNR